MDGNPGLPGRPGAAGNAGVPVSERAEPVYCFLFLYYFILMLRK